MRSLAVQSAVLGGIFAVTTSASAASASSLALGVFRRNTGTTDAHAPNPAADRARPSRNRRLAPSSGDTQIHPARSNYNSNSNCNSNNSPTTAAATTLTTTTTHNPLVRLYHAWLLLPQIFRFFVAGNLGNLGFFYLEKVIFRGLSHLLVASTEVYSFLLDNIEKHQDGLSFFSAYVVQIVTTHLLYAILVYGLETIDTYEKYSKTLWGQFKVYGFGLFGATALNSALIRRGMQKTAAFWVTTASFALVNYVLVSKVVRSAVESSAEAAATASNGSSDDVGTGAKRSPTRRPWR